MTTKPTLLGALAKALPELESAKKNKANPAFKGTKYADLSAVIDALEPLIKHGLWYRQVVHENPDGIAVETFYIHESGDELSAGSLPMPASKRDAQGFGSALTYARRYSLQAAFGLATEDDDGNAAVKSRREEAHVEDAPAKAPAWREPGSTFSTPTALHKGLTRLERELAGCGDSDMVYALCGTDEWREFARVAELHAPHYLRGGDPAPEEFEGLLNTAERMVKQFDSAIASGMVELGRT